MPTRLYAVVVGCSWRSVRPMAKQNVPGELGVFQGEIGGSNLKDQSKMLAFWKVCMSFLSANAC